MLYWMWLETSDLDHKLIRKLFTEEYEVGSFPHKLKYKSDFFLKPVVSSPTGHEKKKAGLRHFSISISLLRPESYIIISYSQGKTPQKKQWLVSFYNKWKKTRGKQQNVEWVIKLWPLFPFPIRFSTFYRLSLNSATCAYIYHHLSAQLTLTNISSSHPPHWPQPSNPLHLFLPLLSGHFSPPAPLLLSLTCHLCFLTVFTQRGAL